MKRLVDLIFAAALTPFAVPLIALLAILVRLDSKGPGIFVQERVGRDEQLFKLYKLRTMHADTSSLPTHEIGRTSLTRVGDILRRTKLDELPQLINVLKGDMSLVGPRPCLPSQDELVAARRSRGVFAIQPGITGPAQLASIDMSTPIKLAEADSAYIDEMGIKADLGYMLATALGRGSGDAIA